MTQEMRELLDEEINSALEAKDNERLLRVMARYHKATGDCQAKTSDRVKKLVEDSNTIRTHVEGLSASVGALQTVASGYKTEVERRKGAMILARALWVVATALASVIAYIIGKGGV